ncbi:MAG: PBP1A family penicillin-binding protein [Patescibacteria group bacterium]|jgi:1A family penicillin-binding protein
MQKFIQGQLKRGLKAVPERLKKLWRNTNKKALLKNVFLASLAFCLFFIIVIAGTFAWYAKDLPNPNGLANRDISQSTKIYDRTGTHLLYQIALNGKRTLVTLDEIPDYVKNATIAAEDRAFYTHHGFTLKGTARAVLFAGQRGGGSTITQQLVKNAILTNERSLIRKLKELILSVALEQIYSKDQILQMYLNEIAYGSANYGIEAAAEQYFSKSAKDLTLAESATLAAIPQRPTTYVNNPDLLKERRDWILNGMVDLGYATREETDVALKEDTTLTTKVTNLSVGPHFVLWVKGILEDKYSTKLVETGGLKVITTLDYDKEVLAEKAVTDGVEKNGKLYNFTDAGLLSLDPKTGQILAMVGSPDYSNNEIDGQVNVTIQPLQPGSSMKPIIYAAAFEKGYTPNTLLWDDNTTFATPTGPYSPKNYDLGEHGSVSMRKALQGSLNIPAVKTLYLVGIDNAVRFAKRLGYSTLNDPSKIGLSMVLGGAEVKLIDHAAAYGVFANGGTYHEPTGILRVENADGSVLEEWKDEEHQGERVIDSNLAAIMSNVLSDNEARSYVFGSNNWLVVPGRAVAAKTGTTNEYKDAWTMGYTPSLVAGVWVGNADGTKMKRADGSQIAAPIWNQYMKSALNGTPVEGFPKADIPQTGKDVLDGKMTGTPVTIDTSSGKLATELTPDRFRKEVICGTYHDILHYVDKDHPTDPIPERPENDPNYKVWEANLLDYITRHNAKLKDGEKPLENCTAPTELDDVHTLANKPAISMMSPVNDLALGRTFNTLIAVEIHRSFSRVEYTVDGVYIATSFSTNGASITLPGWVKQGGHSFAATVYDDVDNNATATAIINVLEAGSQGSFTITNPFNGQTIERSAPTYAVIVEVPHASDYSSLTLTARNLLTGTTVPVGAISSPPSISSISWTLPSAGDYTLEAEATSTTGQVLESTPVKVYVRDPVSAVIIP